MPGLLAFPLRVVVFFMGFVAYWMEIASDWLVGARDKTEYVREGACKRCGRCCRCLSLIMPKGVSSRDWLVLAVRLWHRVGMNFRFIAEEEGWLVYGCGYYREEADGSSGRCSIYPFRHRLCRFFPRQALYGCPSLHPDCGFRFIRREIAEKRRLTKVKGLQTFDDVLRHSSISVSSPSNTPSSNSSTSTATPSS